MIEFDDHPLGQVERLAQSVLVHHGSCHCAHTQGGACQVDVLRHIACVHVTIALVLPSPGALVTDQQERLGGVFHELLRCGERIE